MERKRRSWPDISSCNSTTNNNVTTPINAPAPKTRDSIDTGTPWSLNIPSSSQDCSTFTPSSSTNISPFSDVFYSQISPSVFSSRRHNKMSHPSSSSEDQEEEGVNFQSFFTTDSKDVNAQRLSYSTNYKSVYDAGLLPLQIREEVEEEEAEENAKNGVSSSIKTGERISKRKWPTVKKGFMTLPSELQCDIFQRLGTKDIFKLRCVSKDWQAEVTSKEFNRQWSKEVLLVFKSQQFSKNVFKCWGPRFEQCCRWVPPHAICETVYEGFGLRMISSSNGLITMLNEAKRKLLIWNPETNETTDANCPYPKCVTKQWRVAIGCGEVLEGVGANVVAIHYNVDSVENEVFVVTPETKRWESLARNNLSLLIRHLVGQTHSPDGSGRCYWLFSCRGQNHPSSIVAFHFKTKRLELVNTPRDHRACDITLYNRNTPTGHRACDITLCNGTLCYISTCYSPYPSSEYSISLWDRRENNEWVNFLTVGPSVNLRLLGFSRVLSIPYLVFEWCFRVAEKVHREVPRDDPIRPSIQAVTYMPSLSDPKKLICRPALNLL